MPDVCTIHQPAHHRHPRTDGAACRRVGSHREGLRGGAADRRPGSPSGEAGPAQGRAAAPDQRPGGHRQGYDDVLRRVEKQELPGLPPRVQEQKVIKTI